MLKYSYRLLGLCRLDLTLASCEGGYCQIGSCARICDITRMIKNNNGSLHFKSIYFSGSEEGVNKAFVDGGASWLSAFNPKPAHISTKCHCMLSQM